MSEKFDVPYYVIFLYVLSVIGLILVLAPYVLVFHGLRALILGEPVIGIGWFVGSLACSEIASFYGHVSQVIENKIKKNVGKNRE